MIRDPIDIYNEHFKAVRNQLRKYHVGELVGYCLALLPHSLPTHATMRTYQRYPPWMLLMLTKWALVHGDMRTAALGKLNDRRFEDLINRMHAIDGDLPLPSTFETPYFFLRKIAYQQFWYHNILPSGGYVARQYAMFSELENNHRFRSWLITLANITIEDALDLSFAVITRFSTHPTENWVSPSWFDALKPDYDDALVEKYLDFVTATPERLRAYLRDREPSGKRHYFEWHEPTPLMKFPLIELEERFYAYSRPVLFQSINHLLFDRLREYDPERFMSAFSGIFERYIESGIIETGYEYLSEDDLVGQLPAGTATTDFLIFDGSAHIYVEVKGTELSLRGMVGEYYDQVFDQAKNSVIRGVAQGLNCAAEFESRNRTAGFNSIEYNFLLVVTFKPTFLPRGGVLFADELTSRLASRLTTTLDQQKIAFDKIYFISVQEWDLLVSAVVNKGDSMASVIHRIVENDRSAATARFVIEQHIAEMYPDMGLPPYLNKRLDQGTARLETVLERAKGSAS